MRGKTAGVRLLGMNNPGRCWVATDFLIGLLRGVGLFLMTLAVLAFILTGAGLAIYVIDRSSLNQGTDPLQMLGLGALVIVGVGGLGWTLWRVAERRAAEVGAAGRE